MANQPSPDRRLVYLHCLSIFSGVNARIRRLRAVSRLLQQHQASIKILTREFTLSAIAAIAKELLEEQIFESIPRAKLRFPELFQPSKTQEAERAASEVDIVRIEAEAAQDIALKSDDDRGDECLDLKRDEQCVEPTEILEDKKEAPKNIHTGAVELRQVLFRGLMLETG